MSEAMQNGLGVPMPMFASATQGSKLGDDIDLNDIFADYLTTEVDDPLNPLNFSMGAHTGAAVAATLAHQQQHASAIAGMQAQQALTQAPTSLPTGRGIKTAWHAGTLSNISGGAAVRSQTQHSSGPMVKKPKTENINNNHPAVPAPAAAAAPVSGAGISGRLGFSMVGGQVALPQKQQPEIKTVALPVGVGIRVGGSIGAVPQTAPGGAVSMTHAQWGTAGSGQLTQAQGQVGAPGPYLMWGGLGSPSGSGGMSDQAIAERRQRNREHAKRSRVRKKFMLESLQEQVRGLQRENEGLRMLIQQKIPQHAQKIMSECCAKNPLFNDEADGEGGTGSDVKKAPTELVRSDFSLIESLTSGQQNFVLSDPRLPDNPIVYASEGFYELSGYTREQVLGRNCRFLQGPGTDPRAVDVIRTAIASGTDATTCLLNYKADGTPFWNQFFVAALRDQDNCIVNYVGVQCEVEPDAGASALEDKVNSVLPLQNKEEEDDKQE